MKGSKRENLLLACLLYTSLGELMKTDEELTKARDRIHALQAEVEEKNFQIRKEQEVQRLTNNHVANLEVMIKDLRHEIDELGRLATYLNGHEALIFLSLIHI